MKWLLFLLVVAGCQAAKPINLRPANVFNDDLLYPSLTPFDTQPQHPIIHCYNRDLEFTLWEAYLDAKQRFKNPILVTCHGGVLGGQWVCCFGPEFSPHELRPSVEELAKKYAAKFPDNDIVLSICNPEGVDLKDCPKRVYYWKTTVAVLPDIGKPFWRGLGTAQWPFLFEAKLRAGGSIWEAVNTYRDFCPTP
jgi:hypothetical protein